MYHMLEEIFKQVLQYSIMAMEAAGMLIVLVTAVKCLIQYVRGREHVRIELAEGISMALLFKMGGEVLRTVIVRTWDELAILGAIIVIRGALTFLLHWEICTEKAELDAKKSLRNPHRQGTMAARLRCSSQQQ